MSWTVVVHLVFSVCLWLSAPGSAIIASGQGQMADVEVLERGDDWQCPSMDEREKARNKIHRVIASVIATTYLTTTTVSTTTMPSITTSATTTSTMTGRYSYL